jgi:hypothetical protein
MSFLRSSFSIRKTKPRKAVSRSPLKLPSEDLARELGPQYQTIDAHIGNQKMVFDIAQGDWIDGNHSLNYKLVPMFFLSSLYTDGTIGTTVSSREMTKLEKKKRELEEDNNILRAKMEILLEMLAEVTAEHELRRPG